MERLREEIFAILDQLIEEQGGEGVEGCHEESKEHLSCWTVPTSLE
jgi:hypothetical protein